ncbi:MAG: RNA 2',3'-cyclic phosphodiesterase [Candidatus Cloacimonadales bacterium]|jgi:2'-5' RNA ligase|nr:RNA 2',3'-cyclic phosphodiesterase [Candidatus Cloacimonadota bacterium]MDX9976721.1 RNA 2',3'-cyclic phosphodiesterase [Candidatus Cloacimonadales bacterium]
MELDKRSDSNLQRTFIAFEPNDDVKSDISFLIDELAKEYPQIRNWTKKENLHFTFKFIGDTQNEDIEKIAEYVSNLGNILKPIYLHEGHLEWYPFNNSPLICMMYEMKNSFLIKQYHLLGDYLQELGYRTDRRRLNFHLTLARLKGIEISPKDKILIKQIREIKLGKLIYYRSILHRTGAEYQIIKEINLKEE